MFIGARDDIAFMTLPTLFIPHGGGPCFFMDPNGGAPDPMWQPMQAYLAQLIGTLPERPTAILLISGHWEEADVTVHVGERPSLLYDYYGFPEHTYHLKWDAPGAPLVARRAARLLRDAGINTQEEGTRGWDHGVFVPMKVMLPDADIPLVQMSLRTDLDPAGHIAIGRALAPLRDEGVLIVGSGMSFHNLGVRGEQARLPSQTWDAALTDAVTDSDATRRAMRVADWASLPNAALAHPREEHLLPLMVALGAAGDGAAVRDYADTVLGWSVSGYRFG